MNDVGWSLAGGRLDVTGVTELTQGRDDVYDWVEVWVNLRIALHKQRVGVIAGAMAGAACMARAKVGVGYITKVRVVGGSVLLLK